jgi:hypothetical protein
MKEKNIIIKLMGGMGNQMFQYALGKKLELIGNKVCYDTSSFAKDPLREYQLGVFENISLKLNNVVSTDELELTYLKRSIFERGLNTIIPSSRKVYYEKTPFDEKCNILKIKSGLVVGYFQNEKYFADIRDELVQDYRFPVQKIRNQDLLKKVIEDKNSVAVHIRRSDYLKFPDIYGGICDEKYYLSAMDIMKDKITEPSFYFFSDDIEWVKAQFGPEAGIYVSKDMIEGHEDWMDMCIMSCCSHNIIANSTFSWWAAWLNSNTDKIVISPRYLDHHGNSIGCKEWILIG